VARTLHSWTKTELLLPHFGVEDRVSMILPQAVRFLRDWSDSAGREFGAKLHLLIDEAQDCDKHQWQLLTLLRDFGAEIIVVGDPRQVMYGFQGAHPMSMLRLHGTHRQHRLTLNYRSTETIVELANVIVGISIPQCPVTGLESEHKYAQSTPACSARGDLVMVHHVLSLQHYHLKNTLNEILNQPRPQPACMLTWMNVDVDKQIGRAHV
jgi:hypothetical protein